MAARVIQSPSPRVELGGSPVRAEPPHVSLGLANDPSQFIEVVGRNRLVITGRVSNDGPVPSTIRLTVDGQSVFISLRGGETPEQTAERIQRGLPAGYQALVSASASQRKAGGPSAIALTFFRARTPADA